MAGRKKLSERAAVQKDLAEQPAYIEKLRTRVDQANAKILDLMNENESLKNELDKLADRQNILETVAANQPEQQDVETLLRKLAESGRKFKIDAGSGDIIKLKPYINDKGKPALRASITVDGEPYLTLDGEIKLIGKGKQEGE
jgi:small-conductance mechanosensitive channel